MTYDEMRTAETLRRLDQRLGMFTDDYVPGRPTLLLLVGGMASTLSQAEVPFIQNPDGGYSYDEEWLGIRSFFGCLPQLAMSPGDVDKNDCVTVADGVIGLLGLTFYTGFEQWCRDNALNALIIPWDWRRRVEAAVRFLDAALLPAVQDRIAAAGKGDFHAGGCHLISHSFGGLVLKAFLDSGSQWVGAVRTAIAVAAPFYGYGGSQHFPFAGYSLLTNFYRKSTLARLIGAMPGPYVLNFLEPETYAPIAEHLAADPYPLHVYPSEDRATGLAINPYLFDPERYPSGGWVDQVEMQAAALARRQISTLSPMAMQKLHCIRGVQIDNGAPVNGTAGRQLWATIAPGFDPDSDADPIDSIAMPGDDTVPAWSARLVGLPPGRVITITENVEHMTLMDNPAVLGAIGRIIGEAEDVPVTAGLAQSFFEELWEDTAPVVDFVAAHLTAILPEDWRAGIAAAETRLGVMQDLRHTRHLLKNLLRAPGAP